MEFPQVYAIRKHYSRGDVLKLALKVYKWTLHYILWIFQEYKICVTEIEMQVYVLEISNFFFLIWLFHHILNWHFSYFFLMPVIRWFQHITFQCFLIWNWEKLASIFFCYLRIERPSLWHDICDRVQQSIAYLILFLIQM